MQVNLKARADAYFQADDSQRLRLEKATTSLRKRLPEELVCGVLNRAVPDDFTPNLDWRVHFQDINSEAAFKARFVKLGMRYNKQVKSLECVKVFFLKNTTYNDFGKAAWQQMLDLITDFNQLFSEIIIDDKILSNNNMIGILFGIRVDEGGNPIF